MLNADVTNQFRFDLDADERILWAGQPRQGIFLRPQDFIMIPFSLLWGGFAIFWTAMAMSFDGPGPFAFFGLPFVLIGLYIIFGRFFYDRWIRKNTFYAITSQRILIRTGGRVASLSSVNLATIPEITFQEHRDGRGSIFFGAIAPYMAQFSSRYRSRMGPYLDQVENGQQVYQILRRAQQDAIHYAARAG